MKDTEDEDINGLISSESLGYDNKERLLEAELLHRSHQVRNFDRFKYDLTRDGEDHAVAFKRLSRQRDQLLERFRVLRGPSDMPGTGQAEAALAFSRLELVGPRPGRAGEGPFVFGSEGCVALPRASDGVSVVPSPSVAKGTIVTTALGPLGNISFAGVGPSSECPALCVEGLSGNERVWLRNWRNVVLFPCVSTASFLTYRFEVHLRVQLFSEANGFIMSFASVGEEPSASPTGSIAVNTPAGWPLIADVQEPSEGYNGHYGFKTGSLTVERTFEVGAGRTPAVAIVVGFVVRLTAGRLRLTFFGDSQIGFGDGRVCYRYTPIPVIGPT